jgi:signal transduction protein with GAF and PtsI domain
MQASNGQIGGALAAEIGTTVPPLLELAMVESNAQGAYLYHLDGRRSTASLIAWVGLPALAGAVQPEVQGSGVAAHFRRSAPIVLHENAWSSEVFEAFAEFRTNQFAGVVSIPLVDSGQTVGMVNICRVRPDGLKPREFSFLMSLSVPLAGLVAASQARLELTLEVEKLARQLSDRKILDRAKGLIQSRFDWTEEQAYFCLRNLSRRTRTPMRAIAEEVIETGASLIAAEGGWL